MDSITRYFLAQQRFFLEQIAFFISRLKERKVLDADLEELLKKIDHNQADMLARLDAFVNLLQAKNTSVSP